MTITPLRDAGPLVGPGGLDLPAWDEPAALRPPARSRWMTQLRRTREIGILTAVVLIGYIAAALWVRYGLHYWINDALNRTDNALYTTIGRDPHLGAIGFYWPPLPQLLQMPLMPFLRPLGAEILAGPLSSAICMAATIPVLARIGQRIGVGRWTTFGICVTFAVNPDIIFTAANGMSEACFLLSGAVTMLGFLTYIQTRSTRDLLIFTLGLTAAVMTRLEGPVLVFALVMVATFSLRHLRTSLWQFFVIIAPPFATFAFWVVVQWILLKDPLFFLRQNGGKGPPPGTAVWLPNIVGHRWAVVPWAMGWVVVLGPVLFVLVASFVARPFAGRTRGALGILAGIGVFLVIQMFSVGVQDGFGDPRYFVMTILFATIGAMWLASAGDGLLAGAWNLLLSASLMVSGGTASYALTSGRITHVEQECSFFQFGVAKVLPFLGRVQTGQNACIKPGDGLRPWQDADHWIDANLKSTDRILADNSSDYAAELFSTRPKLFIVRNDRDWQKTVANPTTVTYVMTQSTTPDGPPTAAATYARDEGGILLGMDQVGWHLLRSFAGAQNVVHQNTFVQIWHFVPSVEGGKSPAGSESNLS